MLSPPLRRLLVKWLQGISPKELEALATRNASIVEYLRRRYGSLAVAWAHGYLKPSERDQIAELTDADFDQLLDGELASACPSQAVVLMRHRAWYRGQMRAVQAALGKTSYAAGRLPLAARE